MIAYNNSQNEKDEAVARAEHHRDTGMLQAGTYGQLNGTFHGCDVGCDAFDITGMIQKVPHQITAKYFGFPEWLEQLRDTIFEGLSQNKRVDHSDSILRSVCCTWRRDNCQDMRLQLHTQPSTRHRIAYSRHRIPLRGPCAKSRLRKIHFDKALSIHRLRYYCRHHRIHPDQSFRHRKFEFGTRPKIRHH